MDIESVTTYSDAASFDKIFNNEFTKFQSFIKDNQTVIRVKFLSFADNKLLFEIKDFYIIEKDYLILCRNTSGYTFYAFLKFLEKKDSVTYIFSPVKIQVVYTPRKEERIILDPQNKLNHRLFIANMISEYIIKNSLEYNKKKKKAIEDTIKIKLEQSFDHIRLYFLQYGKDDRMNYFKDNIRPIFIADIHNEPEDKHKEFYHYYIKNIYSNDNNLTNNRQLISEISVPIVYRMKIPYGYVQVNNKSPFAESAMQVVKKMAVITNELLNKHGFFPQAEERIAVSDVSKSGLGVIFKDKQCIKYFSKDQLVYFDLVLPDNTKSNMLAGVQNISINGSSYKVGCKIIEIDALSEVNYFDFLESLGLKV
ncbi:MAG: hypothetical protein V1874_16760 [Spirochaetota bacterium]